MKSRIALTAGGIVLSCVVLANCGGGNNGAYMPPAPPTQPSMPPPSTPPPMTMELDTAAVLAIVKTKTSETAEPFQVDDSAVALTPVGDQTGVPLSVDAT
jgi:hypothetical protein